MPNRSSDLWPLAVIITSLTVLVIGGFFESLADAYTAAKPADWLGFWGGVVGGVMTLIAAVIAWRAVRHQVKDAQNARDEELTRAAIAEIETHQGHLWLARSFLDDVEITVDLGFRTERFDENPALQRLVNEAHSFILIPCIDVWRLANGVFFSSQLPVGTKIPVKDANTIKIAIKRSRKGLGTIALDNDECLRNRKTQLLKLLDARNKRFAEAGVDLPEAGPPFPYPDEIKVKGGKQSADSTSRTNDPTS